MENLPEKSRTELELCAKALKDNLKEDLSVLALYGSAVRGGFNESSSDINLLIVLKDSVPRTHLLVAEILQQTKIHIEPFVVSEKGFERSFKSFAIKFQSIMRQHQLLFGQDPFTNLNVDPKWARFLTEQALRNLSLRMARAFVVFGKNKKRYSFFLREIYASIFVDLSEPLRCENISIPEEFKERIIFFEKTYDMDASALSDLIVFHDHDRTLSMDEVVSFHSRLFAIVDHAVRWVESRWQIS